MIHRDEGFVCASCGVNVPPLGRKTCRNHCPSCLSSMHVDLDVPGDRASKCGGIMPAVVAQPDAKRGIILLHRCRRCGTERWNRVAEEGPRIQMPDSIDRVLELMRHVAEEGS
ncbi:MAG: RNHCP domain-containing protein [Gemmatimonadetes bacterium]|nr:RNHCP domain-containing protein [Gemmatimonadota bacterium]